MLEALHLTMASDDLLENTAMRVHCETESRSCRRELLQDFSRPSAANRASDSLVLLAARVMSRLEASMTSSVLMLWLLIGFELEDSPASSSCVGFGTRL